MEFVIIFIKGNATGLFPQENQLLVISLSFLYLPYVLFCCFSNTRISSNVDIIYLLEELFGLDIGGGLQKNCKVVIFGWNVVLYLVIGWKLSSIFKLGKVRDFELKKSILYGHISTNISLPFKKKIKGLL